MSVNARQKHWNALHKSHHLVPAIEGGTERDVVGQRERGRGLGDENGGAVAHGRRGGGTEWRRRCEIDFKGIS